MHRTQVGLLLFSTEVSLLLLMRAAAATDGLLQLNSAISAVKYVGL
jgi:hypothetical protein